MNDIQEGFRQWLMLSKAKGSKSKREPSMRAVPAIPIEIDIELANAPYDN